MSSTQTINERSTQAVDAGTVGLKLEVVIIPVADVDRAKRFYEGLGWRLDADFAAGELASRAADTSRLTVLRPSSVRESRRPCRARFREHSSSSRTSRPHAPSSSHAAST